MNGLLLVMVQYYMYMYAREIAVTHLFHVGKVMNLFFVPVFKTRYWKKWTCHCVKDPKDLITARKKSTTFCCHIAGLTNLISEQGSAC